MTIRRNCLRADDNKSVISYFLADNMRVQRYFCLLALLLFIDLTAGQNACPLLYMRYSDKHTFCLPPNRQCEILQTGLASQYIPDIVRLHNEKRERIALGKERIGNLPPAADMIEMEWDEELAAVAQKHADQCKFEHDCNECRQIKNFPVGQNLYESWSIGGGPPEPAWKDAIDYWYDEVEFFNKKIVGAYSPVGTPGPIGHFTQIIWSQTWKIGCGYVVYKSGEEVRQLYTCNYGPAGNKKLKPVYNAGKTCSRCPMNSCCGKTCNGLSNYDGLCKILNSKAAEYPVQGSYDYYCDLDRPISCKYQTPIGMKQWEVSHTLAGSFIGIVLNGGETSVLNFTTEFSSANPSCFSVKYRKGPNVAGQGGIGDAKEHFLLLNRGFTFDVPLSMDGPTFTTFGMTLNWDSKFMYSVSFSVPPGNPSQYLELKDINLKRGACSIA